MDEIKTRGPRPTDIPFIYSTWLDSYRHDSDIGRNLRSSIFYENYQLIIDSLLDKSDILLAVSKDDEDVIFGYMVASKTNNTIHYVFVKHAFRGLGIAKMLFKEQFNNTICITITHKTKYISPLLENKSYFIYNPFTLYKGV